MDESSSIRPSSTNNIRPKQVNCLEVDPILVLVSGE